MIIDPRRLWPEVLPGWKMRLNEASYGHYEVLITDDFGRQAGTSGTDADVVVATCEQYVLDIERQISKNLNGFLYDLFKLKLKKANITDQNYNDAVFGSWFIEIADKRLVFDGKDSCLFFQYKENEDWQDNIAIEMADITIKAINELIALM
jgi:hypothetical protein